MPNTPAAPSITRMNVRFDQWTMSSLVNWLLSHQGPCMVVTPNTDHVVRCNQDPAFASIYQSADISFNDSRVLSTLTRWIGRPIGPAMCGSDVTAALLERLAGSDTPVGIIGCSSATVQAVKKRYRLGCVHHHNPPMGFINRPKEVAECIAHMKAHPAQFTIVSVGSPRQEMLARMALDAGVSSTMLCVGASLLFLSGEERRAPQWVQSLSLEWLYRLLQSPKRLAKRYLVDDVAIFSLLWKEWRRTPR